MRKDGFYRAEVIKYINSSKKKEEGTYTLRSLEYPDVEFQAASAGSRATLSMTQPAPVSRRATVATLPAEAKAGVCPRLSGREMMSWPLPGGGYWQWIYRAPVQDWSETGLLELNQCHLNTCSRRLTSRPHLARVRPLPACRWRRSEEMPPPAGDDCRAARGRLPVGRTLPVYRRC